jgi:hypothetical protein
MIHECKGCHQNFIPRPNVPAQHFCGKKECQLKRRSEWQRHKLADDPDYRAHQEKAKSNWRDQHRDYMRNYRANHPEYRERERQQRRERRLAQANPVCGRVGRMATEVDVVSVAEKTAVNMDVCTSNPAAEPVKSGYFRVCRVTGDRAVNMDECPYGSLVQLFVIQEDRAFTAAYGGAP